MDLSEIRAPVAADIQAVDRLILRRLESDVALINQIGHYIVGSGGKRLTRGAEDKNEYRLVDLDREEPAHDRAQTVLHRRVADAEKFLHLLDGPMVAQE